MRHAAPIATVLLLGAAPAMAQGRVQGVVRSDATGAPIVGARVELREPGVESRTRTDSAGGYILRDLRAGTHRVLVAAAGFDSLLVDVLLPADAPLRLDLTLTPLPAPLAAVHVRARATSAARGAAMAPAEAGSWRIDGDALHASPAFDDADPLQILVTAPQSRSLPEPETASHVRGGAADQTRYLLDGAPVYVPVHAGPVPSAFNPDAVSALVLHDGAPPARYGGALASVVDVRTLDGVPNAASARGAFGPTALRAAVGAPLAGGRAGLLVSGRHSYSGLRSDAVAETAMPGTWSDLLGKLTVRVGADVVTLTSFATENGLGFPAAPVADGHEPEPAAPYNRVDWASTTHALTWIHPAGTHATVETRLWTARSNVSATWLPDSGALAVRDAVRHDGLSVVATHRRATGALVAGVEAERLETTYAVSNDDEHAVSASAPPLRRAAGPRMLSAFVEQSWHVARSLAVDAGVRATANDASAHPATLLEPRVSATLRPSPRVAISAAYARLHQYTQSLRNEESIVGASVVPDLLIASDGAAVPIAASDALTATAVVSIDSTTSLRLDAYTRRSSGLVLVAPATAGPFATHAYAVGTGADWGADVGIERRRARLAIEGHYAVGTTTRRTAAGRYHPAFAPDQVASLALALQAGRRTSARAAVWAATGRRTTLLADPIAWDARDAFSGAREISGTPGTAGGPLDGTALPGFLRLDLGVRHTFARWHGRDTFVGTASVSDVLGRENVAGYAREPGSSARHRLGMLPPSLLLGLAWGH